MVSAPFTSVDPDFVVLVAPREAQRVKGGDIINRERAAGIRIHGRSLISSVNVRSFSASPETESDISVTSIRR